MLETKELNIKLSSKNINYYEQLGYNIPKYKDTSGKQRVKKGTEIKIKIEHLPLQSHNKVDVKCDYCEKVFPKPYYSYINSKNTYVVNKDACNDCKYIKIKECNLINYGYENTSQIPEYREHLRLLKRNDFEKVKRDFENMNFTLLTTEDEYINSRQSMKCICNNHPNIIQEKEHFHTTKDVGCKYCRAENISGEGNWNYQGGITPLHNYLRQHILQWKKDSILFYNGKCVLTNNTTTIVHHLYSFNLILQELIQELKLDMDFTKIKVEDLPDDQLKLLKDRCLELHYKYGLGVCLSDNVHKLFHSLYSYGNNIPEQFTEFQQRYNNGEFTSLLLAK